MTIRSERAPGHRVQRSRCWLAALVVVGCALSNQIYAQASRPAGPTARQHDQQALLSDKRVQAALEQIREEDAKTLREQIEIAQIPAPPFKESVRAQDYLQRLRALGLSDAAIDAEGNVIARRKGTGGGPTLVLSAHLDTVFPEGTDVTVREKDGRYYGRGLADDSRGLAVLLTVLRAMQDNKLRTVGDVLFVGTVGEEGLGNLRGVKALFRDHAAIDGFISVDSVNAPDDQDGRAKIINQATGSRRWLVTFAGPGGHSFNNFGSPSAVHAMGRAIARIADLRTPADPKTTFTVGVVSGGTSVNAIAGEAQLQMDMRSNSADELAALEQKFLAIVKDAAAAENARWQSGLMTVTTKLLGDRPAGVARDTPVVQAALQAAAALVHPQPVLAGASTDSNVAMGLGIPAATLSGGGRGDKAHSLEEWYEPLHAWFGPQSVLLTTLALVGVAEVSEPRLQPFERTTKDSPAPSE